MMRAMLEPGAGAPGFPAMRVLLPLLPIVLLAACGRQDGNQAEQSGVVANIMDQALPATDEPAPAPNAITPIEPPPDKAGAKRGAKKDRARAGDKGGRKEARRAEARASTIY